MKRPGLFSAYTYQAATLLGKIGFYDPPVDIELLARKVGISEVRRADLALSSGMLIRTADKSVVLLNRTESRARQRFTLAHEVAHFVLGTEHDETMGRWLRAVPSVSNRRPVEEKECDQLASELLMPMDCVLECVAQHAPSIAQVEEIAALFNVSVQSAALKLAQISPKSCRVIVWEKRGNLLRRSWSAGRGRGLNGVDALSVTQTSSAAVKALLTKTHQVGFEFGSVGGKTFRYPSDSKHYGSKRGSRVLSVLSGSRQLLSAPETRSKGSTPP